MAPYGKDFQRYYVERTKFYHAERTRQRWVFLGVLTQLALIIIGIIFLPAVQIVRWTVVVLISIMLTLWGLVNVWWQQRKYSTFDRWKKYIHNRDGAISKDHSVRYSRSSFS